MFTSPSEIVLYFSPQTKTPSVHVYGMYGGLVVIVLLPLHFNSSFYSTCWTILTKDHIMYKWIVFIMNISRNLQTISQIILPTPIFKIDIVGKWHHSIFLAENWLILDTVFSMCLGLHFTCIQNMVQLQYYYIVKTIVMFNWQNKIQIRNK